MAYAGLSIKLNKDFLKEILNNLEDTLRFISSEIYDDTDDQILIKNLMCILKIFEKFNREFVATNVGNVARKRLFFDSINTSESLHFDCKFINFYKTEKFEEDIDKKINELHEKIKHGNFKKEDRLSVFNELALNFIQKAEKSMEIHYFRSFNFWISALINYEHLLELDRKRWNCRLKKPFNDETCQDTVNFKQSVIIGYARCLLNLSKYNRTIKFLSSRNNIYNIEQNVDYWITLAIAYRKNFQYKEAQESLKQAYKISKKFNRNGHIDYIVTENDLIKKHFHQKECISKTKANRSPIPKCLFKKNCIECENYDKGIIEIDNEEILKQKRVKKFERFKNTFYYFDNLTELKRYSCARWYDDYKILAIDGGGISSIIPAVLLCEIENRTHKHISQLFNMLASTSISGMIAAGLSLPQNNDESGQYIPKYKTFDVLDRILMNGKSIFTRNKLSYLPLSSNFTSKYDGYERYKVFKEIFGEHRLEESMIDLVIPACGERNLLSTHVFSRYDAKKEFNKNYKIVDVLMAASATPKYFPSYFIKDEGFFHDGSLYVKNPALLACNEAIKYGHKFENQFVLSIGTGASFPMKYSRFDETSFEAQAANTDLTMFNVLKQNYDRWQVWYENDIQFDDCCENNMLLLQDYAFQYIEENDCSLRNLLKKIDKDYS